MFDKALPLSDDEVKRMRLETKIEVIDFKIGDKVQIVSGPLDGFEGAVIDLDIPNQKEKQELINLDAVTETPADTVLLFTTQTCPNCKIAETFLQKANVPYQKVVAEENASLVQQYSIMKAPTLIVQHGDQITKFDNASDIRRYSDSVTK